jgi:hypothetical protein
VKLPELVVVPFGVVTLTGPLVAPAGTTAVIIPSELTLKLAATPLNLTDVAPVKWAPPIPTLAPTGPLDGEKPLTDGPGTVTVKLPELVAVPFGVVTLTGPLVALFGTWAVISFCETTVKLAETPLNLTEVAPVKLFPPICTVEPAAPLEGENPSIEGVGTVIVKLPELVALPFGVVTVTGPLVVPLGTIAVIVFSELTVKLADVPLNFTEVAPVKRAPPIPTDVPAGPLDGEKPLTDGVVTVTVKLPELVTVPFGVTTVIGPLVAPEGTCVVIRLSEATVKSAPVPLNRTAVAPEKLCPPMLTDAPTAPLEGLMP